MYKQKSSKFTEITRKVTSFPMLKVFAITGSSMIRDPSPKRAHCWIKRRHFYTTGRDDDELLLLSLRARQSLSRISAFVGLGNAPSRQETECRHPEGATPGCWVHKANKSLSAWQANWRQSHSSANSCGHGKNLWEGIVALVQLNEALTVGDSFSAHFSTGTYLQMTDIDYHLW